MMRVLVTGHEGYIGADLVPMLQERGHEVVGVDTGFFKDCFMNEEPAAADSSVKADTRNVRDVFAGVDAVIQLAALSNDPMGDLDESLTEDINVLGTYNVAKHAKAAGVKLFMFASSCSVYGSGAGDTVLSEASPVAPITAYAKSKAKSEAQLEELADDSFQVVALRAATVFGYSERTRLDLVINELAANSVVNNNVTLKSTGEAWRPFVHVKDLANAYITILENSEGKKNFDYFNIGSEATTFRIIDVAEAIAAQTGAELIIEEGAQPDTRNYRVNFDKFSEVYPSWSIQWDLARGVEDLVTNFKRMNMDDEAMRGDRFRRLPHLVKLQEQGVIDERLKLV